MANLSKIESSVFTIEGGKQKSYRLKKFWSWVITPAIPVKSANHLRQSRLLATMLIVLFSLGTLAESYSFILAPDYYQGHSIAILAIASLGAAFILNRLGRLTAAVWITILVPSAAIFGVSFFSGIEPVELDYLALLFIPLSIASIFLSEKSVLTLSAFNLAAIFTAPLYVPGIDYFNLILSPAFFVASACGLIVLSNRHRKALERDRQKELLEKEGRYRSLFEGANDAIFLIDENDIHLACNQKAADLLGYEPNELVGKRVPDIVVHREYPDTKRVRRALERGAPVPAYERTLRRKDGSELPVEIHVTQIYDRDGKPYCIQSIVRDISERKLAEATMQLQLDRLKALREIDRMITSSLDLQLTLGVVLDKAEAMLGTDAARVFLLNPHLGHLELAVERGLHPDRKRLEVLSLDDPLSGQAAAGMRPVMLLSLEAEAGEHPRLKLLSGQGLQSGFAVPLVAKGIVKGVLEVFKRQSFEPEAEWSDFLETLGGQAAIAIDGAELFHNLQRSNMNLIRAYDETLEGWARALELRDKETEGHSQRVTEMTVKMGSAFGFRDEDLVNLRRGALLHDIGKMGIPDAILLKPGPLTDEEWEIMRLHPGYAYQMLSSIPFLAPALDIPYCHHEKWDGTGYPRKLKGEAIPLAARIFAVIDVWDALSSDRPYRPAWPQDRIRAYLLEQSGKHFDPRVLEAFLEIAGLEEQQQPAEPSIKAGLAPEKLAIFPLTSEK